MHGDLRMAISKEQWDEATEYIQLLKYIQFSLVSIIFLEHET